jgi:di/tricarboxylate transporter
MSRADATTPWWLARLPASPSAATLAVVVTAAGLAILIAVGPSPVVMDDEARRVLAIVVLGLGLWGAFQRHAFWPSVLMVGLLFASRVAAAPADVPGELIALYGGSGVWTPLSGFLLGYAFMLPMNTVPNVVMLDAGYFTAREMLGYGTVVTLAAAAILILVALPYWQWLGVLGL